MSNKNLILTDHIDLIRRLEAEKNRVLDAFMRDIKLIQQQEAALTAKQPPAGKWVPLVRRDKQGGKP